MHLRISSREDTRKAYQQLGTAKQHEEAGKTGVGGWARWVRQYLTSHCTGSPATLTVYLKRWVWLERFLEESSLDYPIQVRYRDVHAYLDWRKAQGASHNTALQDMDTFKHVLNEAVRREFCPSNPAAAMRIKREASKVKPEITAEDEATIREALKSKPQWMSDAFEIGLATGRRISEIRIPMASVNLSTMEFTVRMKGGAVKAKNFHASLLPIFTRLKESGAAYAYPVTSATAVKHFCQFFHTELSMPYSSHCFRVTFISRARRNGVDRWTAMQLVDHSSATVHQVYSRYAPTDLRAGLDLAVGGKSSAQPPPLTSQQSKETPPSLPTHTEPAQTGRQPE